MGAADGAVEPGSFRCQPPKGAAASSCARVCCCGLVTLSLSLCTFGCLDDELDPEQGFRVAEDSPEPARATPADEPAYAGSDAGAPATDAGAAPPSAVHDAASRSPQPASDDSPLPELSVFIALERDFSDFLSWRSFDLGEGTHATSDMQGTKNVFINALPQVGDVSFRVGTIIVKTLARTRAMSSWQVHAMVKRGAGYNAQGAYEWEYFDLSLDDVGEVTLVWRGEHAPDGESYSSTLITADGSEVVVEQDCNDCHKSANNDAVLSPPLMLDGL